MVDSSKIALSVAETAELLGVSKSAVYDLIHVTGFPVVHIGRRRVINRRLLAEWLDAQAGISNIESNQFRLK